MGLKILQTPEPGGTGHLSPDVSPNTRVGNDYLKTVKAAQVQVSFLGILSREDIKATIH